jgi:hypothetical protein
MSNEIEHSQRFFRVENKAFDQRYFVKSPLSVSLKSVPEAIAENYILLDQIENRLSLKEYDIGSFIEDVELMRWGIDQLWENPYAMSVFTNEYFDVIEFFESRFQGLAAEFARAESQAA